MSLKKLKIMISIVAIVFSLFAVQTKSWAQDEVESSDDESYIPPVSPSSPTDPNQPILIQDDSEGANGETSYEN